MPKHKKKDEDVNKEVVEKPKKEAHSLYAWFAYIDKEGFKTKSEYKSEGDTPEEALAALDFPKGCNCLVNVTYNKGGRETSRALAPHKARQILEDKDSGELQRLFK